MRWWVTVFVVGGVLWWLAHRHLNRRARQLGMKGARGSAGGCGCGSSAPNALPSVGTIGSSISSNVDTNTSQTSGGLQISPAPVGSLPSSVTSAGPNALPKWDPSGGLWQ